MISIQKSGDTINFTFTDSSHYLYGNGTISVPENSLSLTIDESDIVNFKKADSNDIFISATLGEFGKTKAELIQFYKENMVNAGISSGDVETMISSATSGFADSVSYNSTTKYVEFFNGSTKVFSYDASDFVIDGMVDNVEIKTISSGGTNVDVLAITFNVESGKNEIDIPLSDIFDPDLYYTKTEVDSKLNGKVDTSAFTSYSGSIESRLSEDEEVTSAALNNLNGRVDGKVDTSAITSAVTSGSTDAEIPTAKAVYDAIPQGGGGKAVSGGTNISITTGETADTINCTIPFEGSPSNRMTLGYGCTNHSQYSLVVGTYSNTTNSTQSNIVVGYDCRSKKSFTATFGQSNNSINICESDFGSYNAPSSASTTFGDSGNTLFSIGNGTADNARHNAFEVRQNGDIYCSDGTNDVKLQDTITATTANTTALGGLSLVKLTQAEYSAMEQAGTLDNSTLYIVIDS